MTEKENDIYKKNELLMLFGKCTSRLGNIIFDYANSVSIVHMFNTNPVFLAIYQSSESLISVIFNLFGGALADKGNKRKILITTDILSAIVCFIVAFFIDSKFIAMTLIIANATLAIITAFNSPTYKSIVREITKRDRIIRYNSIVNGVSEVIQIVGPMLGTILVKFIGIKGALLFDSVTFLVSAIAESMLVISNDNKTESDTKYNKKNIIIDIIEGIKYLASEKQISHLVIVSAVVNFFLAGYNLLIPYTDIMYKKNFNNFYSTILIAQSIGGIIGSYINTKIKSEDIKIISFLLAVMGIMVSMGPIVSSSSIFLVALFPYFVFAMAVTMFNIRFMSYVQMKVKEAYLGRVFSIIFTIALIFVPIGSFVFAMICNTLDVYSFIKVGVGIIILSIISLFI